MTLADLPLDDILAHLEALRRRQGSLAVITRAGLELSAIVMQVDPGRRRVVVEIPKLPPRVLCAGDSARLAVPIEGQRWEGTARIELQPDRNRFALRLPGALSRQDRRHLPRIGVAPEEGLRALIHLERRGPALTGPLLNLSAGGFRVQVERAYNIESQARLDPKILELDSGRPLHSVELSGLGGGAIEATGVLRVREASPRGLCLNVQFAAMHQEDRATLRAWAEARWAEPTLPERPVLGRLEPLLLLMPPSLAREALATLLEQTGLGPVSPVATLPDLRHLAQAGPLRGAVLAAGTELNTAASAILRALRGSRPWPILALAPAPPGCTAELPAPLRSSDLLEALAKHPTQAPGHQDLRLEAGS
jgi:hypothetical protein